jgi:hypothetical protein
MSEINYFGFCVPAFQAALLDRLQSGRSYLFSGATTE